MKSEMVNKQDQTKPNKKIKTMFLLEQSLVEELKQKANEWFKKNQQQKKGKRIYLNAFVKHLIENLDESDIKHLKKEEKYPERFMLELNVMNKIKEYNSKANTKTSELFKYLLKKVK